eukprot:3188388-Pyramimonas_sp.AAC.1
MSLAHRCVDRLLVEWAVTVNADPLVLNWDITMEFGSPDCVDRLVINVNGLFPGPEVRVSPGQDVLVTVTNNMPSTPIAIHFHGQKQNGTNYQDGLPLVSSCPISPQNTYTYSFKANDRPGMRCSLPSRLERRCTMHVTVAPCAPCAPLHFTVRPLFPNRT